MRLESGQPGEALGAGDHHTVQRVRVTQLGGSQLRASNGPWGRSWTVGLVLREGVLR
jgi:hypothetical protein